MRSERSLASTLVKIMRKSPASALSASLSRSALASPAICEKSSRVITRSVPSPARARSPSGPAAIRSA